MASVVGIAKFSNFIRGLFPRGRAWRFDQGLKFTDLVEAIAFEPCRVEERGFAFLDEMDPNTTFEMLDNWERLLKIPDECTPEGSDPSLFERRVRVLQKLTTGGGQNEDFFKLIAQQLGYDIGIIDVEDFQDFRVGDARVGDALTNSTLPGGGPAPSGWAYHFRVNAPAAVNRKFRVGQSTVGERLVIVENDTLECVIRKFAPAHVSVSFAFG